MRICGVICEYNPIHNGHVHQISLTRRALGEDIAIAALMSGDFTQRGEPAVFRKEARARAALSAGADVVLELPLKYALSSAEGFAMGGVGILSALGCDDISFGSECGDVSRLVKVAECLLSPEFASALALELKNGAPFAASRQRAAESIVGENARLLQNPNDILGIEYLKALILSDSKMKPFTVARLGAGHDSPDEDGGFLSASALRARLLAGESVAGFMPEAAEKIFNEEMKQGRGPVSFEGLEPSLFYRLRTMTDEEYAALPYASEGLPNRLKKAAFSAKSLDELILAVKTKRYPLSGVKRMLLLAWLGDAAASDAAYIRVLASNERGRAALKKMKGAPVKLLTRPSQLKAMSDEAKAQYKAGRRAESLYELLEAKSKTGIKLEFSRNAL